MAKILKCRSSHCFHESKEIMPDDDFVKVNNVAYHKDCYRAISNIREVIDIFAKEVNPNVVFAQLSKVVNNIVYNKKIDSGLLLYGLRFYLDRKIPIHYPYGLYYVVQNKDVQNQYKKMVAAEKVQDYEFSAPVDESQPFEYTPTTQKGFADILRRD